MQTSSEVARLTQRSHHCSLLHFHWTSSISVVSHPGVVSSAARTPCSNGWIFVKEKMLTWGKFKLRSSQLFESVSRKHKLIYVSFFIKIGQWSTLHNQKVFKLLVVATSDPCLGWLTSHNFPAPKRSCINSLSKTNLKFESVYKQAFCMWCINTKFEFDAWQCSCSESLQHGSQYNKNCPNM